jgi:hypothetical protein
MGVTAIGRNAGVGRACRPTSKTTRASLDTDVQNAMTIKLIRAGRVCKAGSVCWGGARKRRSTESTIYFRCAGQPTYTSFRPRVAGRAAEEVELVIDRKNQHIHCIVDGMSLASITRQPKLNA